MEPRSPIVEIHGPVAFHDQECAVEKGESAVLNMWKGVFEPSRKAQADGWRLVHADTWLKRQALKLFKD